MELPFVYIDQLEQNVDIINVGKFLIQARRILASGAVSDEMKKNIFEISMDCIRNVNQYYNAKEKETQLTKRDAELDEMLHQMERELAVKERINNELSSSIEEKKLKVRISQMAIERSRERTRDLLRQRKELEEENKKLTEQLERDSAAWARSLQIACEQKDRLKALMDLSPRLARQNNERDAVCALTNRLEELLGQKSNLQKDEERLKKELELQTATPLRVYMVNFAKVTLRTMEMQEKLREARKIYDQLKAEEAERRQKFGASDYDVFDASFMSLDLSMRKMHGNLQKTELPRNILPSVLEATEDESGSAETATTDCSRSSPLAEPPRTSSQDIIMARTTAVKKYVEQQSESVSGGLAVERDDTDSGEMTRDEDERMSVCDQERTLPSSGVDVEISSASGTEGGIRTEDANMDDTVEEEITQNQVGGDDDFSDEDAAMNVTVEDCENNGTTEENDLDENQRNEGHSSPRRPTPLEQKAWFPQDLISNETESELSSQKHHQASLLLRTPLRRKAPTHNQDKSLSGTPAQSQRSEHSQENVGFFNSLLNRECSPVHEGVPFSFSGNETDKDDFDPTAALNISTHSNDPGADFLSLIESANEKRVNERQVNSSANEFSFSLFGGAADGAASSGSDGEFAFDFGNPSQTDDGNGDITFQFNFGAPSDEQTTGNDEAFSFFRF
ncbi:hypothetical protein RB195_019728 [Necator americanus]|uniref:Clusterin-associated protein 1 n=1 Tax=Necator americanus TaxID=51031 RepID=A0ABR1CFI2_NECAM